MKDINKIKELLTQASNLMFENIDNAHNIDLEHMSQTIDNMIDDLVEIGDFEVFEVFED
jgi:hypothetical protein